MAQHVTEPTVEQLVNGHAVVGLHGQTGVNARLDATQLLAGLRSRLGGNGLANALAVSHPSVTEAIQSPSLLRW